MQGRGKAGTRAAWVVVWALPWDSARHGRHAHAGLLAPLPLPSPFPSCPALLPTLAPGRASVHVLFHP